jgi:mRNA-degrading endonuclease RelE of RelBE toxin-antitoxin system
VDKGDYRVFYQIDDEEKKVYIFDILPVEQAHKNMEEFYVNYRNFH